MRFNKLDLNLLYALDALLSERSITRAAARINLSQPATSGVLARLREYFNDELLIQVGRTMASTPLALSLQQPVRDILLRIQSTIAVQPDFSPRESKRHFRVMTSDYPISVVISDLSRHLLQVAPGITMQLVMPGVDMAESLDRGEIDLLIMPKQYMAPRHPVTALFDETFSCVICNGNALVGDSITVEQYSSLGHVTTVFGPQEHPSLEAAFLKTNAITRRSEIITNNFNTLPLLVLGTDRIATMHSRLAKMFARYLPLRILPLPVEIPAVTWCMQWPSHLGGDQAHGWFRQQVQAFAA